MRHLARCAKVAFILVASMVMTTVVQTGAFKDVDMVESLKSVE